MTNKQQAIQDYITSITRGIVCLKVNHLNKIIELAMLPDQEVLIAKLYKKNFIVEEFELVRTKETTYKHLEKILNQYGTTSVVGFYRWDIYRDDKLLNQIFTISSNLF